MTRQEPGAISRAYRAVTSRTRSPGCPARPRQHEQPPYPPAERGQPPRHRERLRLGRPGARQRRARLRQPPAVRAPGYGPDPVAQQALPGKARLIRRRVRLWLDSINRVNPGARAGRLLRTR